MNTRKESQRVDITPIPRPSTASDEAKHFLALPPNPSAPQPALDDHAGWQRLVAAVDGVIAQRVAGVQLPVRVTASRPGGVASFTIEPESMLPDAPGPLYIDLHGGALLYGGGDLVKFTGSRTALTTGMATWAVDYRMPPAHPFPAALDDCVAVYRAALETRDPSQIVVGGASAGGNLAAALLLRARDEGLPMPAGLVLLSPEVDLTESGDSFQVLDGVDPVISSFQEVNRLYAGAHDLDDPYVSPLFGDLRGFPATFVQSGTRDLFLSNAVLMHRALRSAGVDARLHVFEAMPHGGFGEAPEDRELQAEVRRFVQGVSRQGQRA